MNKHEIRKQNLAELNKRLASDPAFEAASSQLHRAYKAGNGVSGGVIKPYKCACGESFAVSNDRFEHKRSGCSKSKAA